jgi:hypothetical protein
MEMEYSKMSVPRMGFLAPALADRDSCLAPTRTWLTARFREAKEAFRKWVTPRRFLLFSFLFPFAVRTVPEILAGPWPLGFDTVWVYAPFVKEVEMQGAGRAMAGVLRNQTAPLMYLLLAAVASMTQAAPFVVTKAMAPLLYGLLGFSLYYFARIGLGWNQQKSLWLVVLSVLYFVPLRFSWDLYKNTLGLAFFFIALAHARSPSGGRDRWILAVFLGLSILSEELMAVVVAGTLGLMFIWERVRARRWDWTALVLSAVGVLSTITYLHLILPVAPVASPLAPPPAQSGILYNYVGSNVDVFVYPTLIDVYTSVLTLTAFLFVPILPLIAKGRFRDLRVTAFFVVLGIGSFSILVSPFAALPAWHRWLFMAVFPGMVFATGGLLHLRRRARVTALVILVFLGVAYIGPPDGLSFPYYSTSGTWSYVPPSLMRNTVLLQDCPDVVRAAAWIDRSLTPSSVVLADIWFVGWAELYVNSKEVYLFVDPSQVNGGNFTSYQHVYVLDWALGQGGFQARLLPAGAFEIYVSGRIAVYEIAR